MIIVLDEKSESDTQNPEKGEMRKIVSFMLVRCLISLAHATGVHG